MSYIPAPQSRQREYLWIRALDRKMCPYGQTVEIETTMVGGTSCFVRIQHAQHTLFFAFVVHTTTLTCVIVARTAAVGIALLGATAGLTPPWRAGPLASRAPCPASAAAA